MTRDELGGSLWAELQGQEGGRVPAVVDPRSGRGIFRAVHLAISHGPGPELPRPERGGPGRRPGRDGPRRRPGRRVSRSATSPATTTRLTTPSCSSPNRPAGSSSRSRPQTLRGPGRPDRRPAAGPARRGRRLPRRRIPPASSITGLDGSDRRSTRSIGDLEEGLATNRCDW